MLPSAHIAASAMALVVHPFSPRSRMSCSAAARMWARVPVAAASVTIRSFLFVMVSHVAAHEDRGDHGGEDQERDRHEQADVDGVDEGGLNGMGQSGVAPGLGV